MVLLNQSALDSTMQRLGFKEKLELAQPQNTNTSQQRKDETVRVGHGERVTPVDSADGQGPGYDGPHGLIMVGNKYQIQLSLQTWCTRRFAVSRAEGSF